LKIKKRFWAALRNAQYLELLAMKRTADSRTFLYKNEPQLAHCYRGRLCRSWTLLHMQWTSEVIRNLTIYAAGGICTSAPEHTSDICRAENQWGHTICRTPRTSVGRRREYLSFESQGHKLSNSMKIKWRVNSARSEF
jgi:hypothetical protein